MPSKAAKAIVGAKARQKSPPSTGRIPCRSKAGQSENSGDARARRTPRFRKDRAARRTAPARVPAERARSICNPSTSS